MRWTLTALPGLQIVPCSLLPVMMRLSSFGFLRRANSLTSQDSSSKCATKHCRDSDAIFGKQCWKDSNQSDINGIQAFLGTGWNLQHTSYTLKKLQTFNIFSKGMETHV